jgi:Domain of unknown function (DU1801)
MQRSSTTPDEFIASLPDGAREEIAALDAAISTVMAGLERVLWEGKFWGGTEQNIIGYGAYTYAGKSGSTGEWFIVGLAKQKDHISVYANAAEDGQALSKRYAARLGKVKAGSGQIGFKRLADIDLDVLVEMVGKARDFAEDARTT